MSWPGGCRLLLRSQESSRSRVHLARRRRRDLNYQKLFRATWTSAIAWHEQERQPVCSECPPRVGLVRLARKLRSLASMVRLGRRVDVRAFRPRVLPIAHAAYAPVVEHWNCCRQFCSQCQVEWRRCASSTCSCACSDHSSFASGGVYRTGSRGDRAPVSGFGSVCHTSFSGRVLLVGIEDGLRRVGFCSVCRTSPSGRVHLSGTGGKLRRVSSCSVRRTSSSGALHFFSTTACYAASASAVCATSAFVVEYLSLAPTVIYAASALAVCAATVPMVEQSLQHQR